MLKSHFNLQGGGEEEEEAVVKPEEEAEVVDITNFVDEESRCLNKSEVSVRLSFLGKTAEGDGYTYLKATLTGMSLTIIKAIQHFQHLQFVDLSNNKLDLHELQAVTALPYLIFLQADQNRLKSAALNRMKYIQVIILNNNEITSVNDVYQPELSTLELGFNKIQKVEFNSKMPNIRCLDFRNNKIAEITGFDFPKLDSLYLAGNNIKSLVGIEILVNLRILHLRNNPIRLLDGFHEDQTKLTYVNLRNCKVSTLKQIKKLRVLKGLETLVIRGCPFMGGTGEEVDEPVEEEDPEIRTEVLASLPRLKRLNKQVVTPEEREEAKQMMLQWLEDGEKDEEELVEEGGQEAEQEHGD
ncbi:leucine-rich repeat-containing protein 23-like [Anticarsia gemmatalis]|uniref:leucine-rich repeat-containing protein 23-like n=1 Tax=Anticarsia gemmatalis TaxID=129554 RepID=UPI003F762E3E